MSEPTFHQFWGLLEYKPQWSLSLKGWLILFSFHITFAYFFITKINGFLAFSRPIEADTLLIEGWLIDSALRGAFQQYQTGNYQRIIITGVTIERNFLFAHYTSYAEMAAAYLTKLGVNPAQIITITVPNVDLNRTAAAAIAVKEYLNHSSLDVKAINLYSYDIHTRRSWLIYQKILKPDIQIGAIAHASLHYNPQQWWTSSYGFKSMINEIIAYFYTRLLWFYNR